MREPPLDSLRKDVENYQIDGTHLAGDMWNLTQVITGAFDGSQAIVELTVVQVPVDILDRDGRPVSHIKGLYELGRARRGFRGDTRGPVTSVNRPGMSRDFEPWEGWSHARRHPQAVSA